MYCMRCGGICDPHPSKFCVNCRAEIARNNERVYILSLLKEAYQYVPEIRLREKIEAIVFQDKPEQSYSLTFGVKSVK